MSDLFALPAASMLMNEPWLVRMAILLAVTLLVSVTASFVLRLMGRLAMRTAIHLDDALQKSARRPVQGVIWLIGLTLVGDTLSRKFPDPLFDNLVAVRNVGLVLCIAWFLFGFIKRVSEGFVLDRLQRGEAFDRTTIDALSKFVRLVVAILAVLIVLQTLGVSIAGVLTLGGIGGIAIGFAAKDLLANFFGGLTIYLDRPFAVGDWIRSPEQSIEGTVEHISWRQTRIRGFNKNPIYVPNALFTSLIVENPSRMSHRRIRETIGLRYADFDKVAAVVAGIRAMLEAHPDIDCNQTLIVNFNAYGASSLDIMVYTFTHTTAWVDYQAVKQDVLLKMGEVVLVHGAEIAFPTQTLHVELPETAADRDG